jgi:hypothetical protein
MILAIPSLRIFFSTTEGTFSLARAGQVLCLPTCRAFGQNPSRQPGVQITTLTSMFRCECNSIICWPKLILIPVGTIGTQNKLDLAISKSHCGTSSPTHGFRVVRSRQSCCTMLQDSLDSATSTPLGLLGKRFISAPNMRMTHRFTDQLKAR